jgi:hypothetical protein
MLENRQDPKKPLNQYQDRSRPAKESDGSNLNCEVTYVVDGQNVTRDMRVFEYANDFSTYVVVTGKVDMDLVNDNSGQVLSGDVQYIIHLGDWDAAIDGTGPEDINDIYTNYNNFNTERNTSYTYTVTVNSVNNINLQTEGDLSISTDTTASISTKHGLSLINNENNTYQKVELYDQSIKLYLKTQTNEIIYEVTPDNILLPTGKTTSIYGGDSDEKNFIKYNENNLEISSKELILGSADDIDSNSIITNADTLTIDSETTVKKSFTVKPEADFNVQSSSINIGYAENPGAITINAKTTEFNTGDTMFKGNIGVTGNVTATNVTVNGLLVTETSSVTSVLTHEDGTGWDYPYGKNYDNKDEYVQKMFLFGLTTIDLDYVCNGTYIDDKTDIITATDHFVNGYRVGGDGNPKGNTRNFMNTYTYSDINLNLTAFLNAYSNDSMFARGELTRPNGGDEILVTKIDDVNIKLANPSLYRITNADITNKTVNIPTEHRLKTFLLFIERFAIFADPEADFSIKDVYVLRQAKEISMTMDNFNPDMINHVCVLTPTEKSEE